MMVMLAAAAADDRVTEARHQNKQRPNPDGANREAGTTLLQD
jgi:hypothetical protein